MFSTFDPDCATLLSLKQPVSRPLSRPAPLLAAPAAPLRACTSSLMPCLSVRNLLLCCSAGLAPGWASWHSCSAAPCASPLLPPQRFPVLFLTCGGTKLFADPRMNSLDAALRFALASRLQAGGAGRVACKGCGRLGGLPKSSAQRVMAQLIPSPPGFLASRRAGRGGRDHQRPGAAERHGGRVPPPRPVPVSATGRAPPRLLPQVALRTACRCCCGRRCDCWCRRRRRSRPASQHPLPAATPALQLHLGRREQRLRFLHGTERGGHRWARKGGGVKHA